METATTHDPKAATPAPERGDLARLFVEAFPVMDGADQRLALALYGLLAEGRAVAPASLARALDRPEPDVRRVLGRWPGVFLDDAGAVIGFWGLTVREMAHRVEVNGNTVYAWCAWDTLWLPALLGATAQVVSRCAQTGETVRLRVSPARIESVEPAATVVSFLKPEIGELRAHATTRFCHFVHFLRDPEAASRWTSAYPGTFALSLDEAFDLGRRVNAARYRAALSAQEGPS